MKIKMKILIISMNKITPKEELQVIFLTLNQKKRKILVQIIIRKIIYQR